MVSPHRLDPVTLRLFDAVAETGSLSEACRRLNLAPAAGSRRLTLLEAEAGVRLLERHARGMRLTGAGETVRLGWQGVEAAMSRLATDIDDLAGGLRGHLRIAATASVLLVLPLELLSGLLRQEPLLRLDLRELPTADALAALRAGLVEVALLDARGLAGAGLAVRPWREDRLVAILPPGHPLSGRGEIDFPELLDGDLIGYVQGAALQATLLRAAEAAGRPLRMRVQAQGFETVTAFVRAGFGAALVPAELAARHGAALGLPVLALRDDWALRRHVVVAREDFALLSPAAKRLVDSLVASGGEGARLRPARTAP